MVLCSIVLLPIIMEQGITVLRLLLQRALEGMQVRRALLEHQGFKSPWHVAVLNWHTYLLIRNTFLSHKLFLFSGRNAWLLLMMQLSKVVPIIPSLLRNIYVLKKLQCRIISLAFIWVSAMVEIAKVLC